jgi:hypothetical protein
MGRCTLLSDGHRIVNHFNTTKCVKKLNVFQVKVSSNSMQLSSDLKMSLNYNLHIATLKTLQCTTYLLFQSYLGLLKYIHTR